MTAAQKPMPSQAKVLVTDGNERAALAVTRGLGQAGIPVIVGSEIDRSLASASKYCAGTWRYPSPLQHPDNFTASIIKAIQDLNITQIIAVTDATTQVLADRKEQLEIAGSTIPSYGPYQRVSDKFRLMELAGQLNVPIPDTLFVSNGNVDGLVERVTEYPAIVKPARSLVEVGGKWIKTAVHVVSTEKQLIELYRSTPYLRYPSLIQRRIKGNGEGIFGLFDHGKPCALFAHRRLREKPPAGGVSVLRESIALPKPMTDYALRLLEHVKWHGVAMVEFKVDRHSGTPMLMEINARFWGSLQLAIDAGLNFPYLLYQLANGTSVTLPNDAYRVGTRSRWLLGDFDHLLMRLMKSGRELALGPDADSRWHCLLEFFKFFQRDLHYEVERWNDIGPALWEYRTWLGNVMGGRP